MSVLFGVTGRGDDRRMDLDSEPIWRGRLGQFEAPDWQPLERLLPLELCGAFMWMNDVVLEDGKLLHAYKHSDTRLYLWLDEAALPYEYLGKSRYRRTRRTDAVGFVFDTWWMVHHPELADTVRATLEAMQTADEADDSTRILPASPAAALRHTP